VLAPIHYDYLLQINVRSGPSRIGTPMMRVYRILLVDIHFEELVVNAAFKVLEPSQY